MRTVSIVIPAYNEGRFIATLLTRILKVSTEASGFRKEIIVVNDGSTDDTATQASQFPGVRCFSQPNQGKGAAVQRGIRESSGDYVLVQDADLEYDPEDYPKMLSKVPENAWVAVYGSRTLGQIRRLGAWQRLPGKHPQQGFGPWLANAFLSLWILLLFGRWITDPLTAYKLYPRSFLHGLTVKTHGFETDHELTAKLIRAKVPIVEVPVAYSPRSVKEGKKIRARDGLIAIWTLLRFRFGGLTLRN